MSSVLVNLQTCTIPHFKGNFLKINLSLYHEPLQWLQGPTTDENTSLLFFVTPSISCLLNEWIAKIQKKNFFTVAF